MLFFSKVQAKKNKPVTPQGEIPSEQLRGQCMGQTLCKAAQKYIE